MKLRQMTSARKGLVVGECTMARRCLGSVSVRRERMLGGEVSSDGGSKVGGNGVEYE